MKNLILFLLPVFALTFFSSCGEDNDIATDDVLIEEIASAENKIVITPDELPESAQSYLDATYFDTYAQVVSRVDEKGYELFLGTDELQYFNLEGRPLRAERRGRGFRPFHGPGGCNASMIPVDELPEAITTYIAENYPDAEIRGARERGDLIVVGISGHVMLVFDSEGNFIEEAQVVHHGHGTPLEIEELPTAITDYISTNYAGAEIKKAFEVRDGENIVVGLLLNDERVLVIFDAEGNFIMER